MAQFQHMKRQRMSTGGTYSDTSHRGLPYAHVANIEVGQLSDSEKLDYLCSKISSIELLAQQVQQTSDKLNTVQKVVDDMNINMTMLDDRTLRNEYRLIDLEARSRRNNLIFTNIPEPQGESNQMCENTLCDFLGRYMGLEVSGIVFQRVHRLGPKRR